MVSLLSIFFIIFNIVDNRHESRQEDDYIIEDNPNAGDNPQIYSDNRKDLLTYLNEEDVNQVSIDYNISDNYRSGNNKQAFQKKSNKSSKSAYKSVPKSKANDYNIKNTTCSALQSPEESKINPKVKSIKANDQKEAKQAEHAKIVEMINDSFKNNNNNPPQTSSEFYRVGKVLGKGAFGKVSLALHKLSKKLVALKLLNKEILRNETSKEKVMQEVRILKRFRHPNVVKLYETFESEKHIVLVMEL